MQSQTLSAFILASGSLRKAARTLDIPATTLSPLANGRAKASPATVEKLKTHNVSLEGLVETCAVCGDYLTGSHCVKCGQLRRERKRNGTDSRVKFYRSLVENMLKNDEDRDLIEAVIDEARKRGVELKLAEIEQAMS